MLVYGIQPNNTGGIKELQGVHLDDYFGLESTW